MKLRNIFKPADAPQTVANDFGLRAELGRIAELLEIAAATAAKVRTGRLDSITPRLDYFSDRGKADVAFHPVDLDSQPIARGGQSDKYGAAVGMRKAEPARKDSFDDDFKVVLIEILVVKLSVQFLCSVRQHCSLQQRSIHYNLIR